MRKTKGKNFLKNFITKNVIIVLIMVVLTLMISSTVIKVRQNSNLSAEELEKMADNEDETLTIDTEEDPTWNATSARVYLNWMNTTFGGIEKKNYFHVFAFEGDTICLGTDVYNAGYNLEGTTVSNSAHTDKDSVDIVLYDLDNKPMAIDIQQGQKGHINTIAKEKSAKEMTSTAGKDDYVPYTYTVHETGVYTVEFRSYGNNSIDTKYQYKKDVELKEMVQNGGLISAWDISVFDENNNRKKGRVYADYLSLQTNGVVKEKYYILTNDSYIYEMKFNGISPYTFNFFANNRGLTDSATGNILYKSVKDISNTNDYQRMGVNFEYPGNKETDLSKSFYIFFEKPSEDLEGYMYEKALLPDPATNLYFMEKDGIYENDGGYFSFDVKKATTATLRIEFNIPGKNYEPVEISDVVTPYSTNYFYWDGKDGNGNTIEPGDYSYDEIEYSVTTKAGEIHFPISDMENATEGISFTRISKIYDKNNVQIDTTNNIYDKTRSVIYYDDTAIYYGENAARTGKSENEVDVAKGKFNQNDNENRKYFPYNNFTYVKNGQKIGEGKTYDEYGKLHGLRIGDHSYISNKINYKSTYESQSALVDYLDSVKNPVGLSSGTNGNGTTTDYGVANYWTFITSDTVKANTKDFIKIKSSVSNLFNFVARVFYDENENGTYNPQEDGDHLLSGITLNLYKKTEDTEIKPDKVYVYVDNLNGRQVIKEAKDFSISSKIYELVKTAVTPLSGKYVFAGLQYNSDDGTEYLYEVKNINPSYVLKSGNSKPTGKEEYGNYKLYAYNHEAYGTEIQTLKVGGEDGINFDGYEEKTATTIDVGYHYTTTPYVIQIKKDWQIDKNSDIEMPESSVFEISYNLDNGQTGIYEERVLSSILAWNHKFEFLETNINGHDVKDYYVSAEYYIYKDKIFKHEYQYDVENGIYKSFVAKDYYFSLSEYYKNHGDLPSKPNDNNYTMSNIPDLNNDGACNYDDIKYIQKDQWEEALAAGTIKNNDEVISPFNSVIDRSVNTGTTEITITNASNPGTIEILKYTGALDDENYLKGATFRIYKGNMTDVKNKIDEYNSAQMSLNNATEENRQQLQEAFDKISKQVDEIQIGSSTTRVNGRIAFSGLDPNTTYTVRERFAPSGYRITEEYYQVNSKNTEGETTKFNESNYCLIKVGNAEASGNLEIKKTISGRAWEDVDTFSFDIQFNNDSSGVDVSLAEKALFTTTNVDEDIKNFIDEFNNETNDFTINNTSEYDVQKDKKSIDTKVYKDLLKDGIKDSEKASLNKVAFPAAGNYTFTIRENSISDETLTVSPRVFTVSINVQRVANTDKEEDEEITIDNSHLEASVSKITVQNSLGDNKYSESTIYAGNTPTFINNYIVDDVAQKTNYIVQSNLKGRKDNEWSDTDKFTFILDGYDSETKAALQAKNIEIKGAFSNTGDTTSEKQFVIDNNTAEHKFAITELDFHNVVFPVEPDENGVPVTKPITYYLTIKQQIPKGAIDNVYDGIKYSTDEYTLKIILENSDSNSVDIDAETDGVIDKITLILYKNYNHDNEEANEPYATCIINQSRRADGTIEKEEHHEQRSGSHVMTFKNEYAANIKVSKTWEDNNDAKGKRPDSIKLTLIGRSQTGYNTRTEKTLNKTEHATSEDIWEYTFTQMPIYDDSGKEIKYTLYEQYEDNVFYKAQIEELKPVEGDKNTYQIKVKNIFEIPNENVTVQLSKIWDDNNNEASKRPKSVELILTGNEPDGKKEYRETLTSANKDDSYSTSEGKEKWTLDIQVPKYNSDAEEIDYNNYEIDEEITNKFYTKTIDKIQKTVTNKFTVPNEKVSVLVTKVWNHENNSYTIPTSVKLQVKKDVDGKEKIVEDKVITLADKVGTDENKWSYTFENLSKYDELGNEIDYYIGETEANPGDLLYYKSSINQEDKTITNTYIGPIISQTMAFSTEKQNSYVVEGEKIKYTITIVNKGEIARDVLVKDIIPEETTFVENSIKINDKNTYTLGKDTIDLTKKNLTDLSQTGITVNVPAKTDEADGRITLSFEVKVKDLQKGEFEKEIQNIAQVDGRNTNTVTTQVKKPNITFTKEAIVNNQEEAVTKGNVIKGDIITYKILLENLGTSVGNPIVKDIIPVGTKFIEGSIKIDNESMYQGTNLAQKDDEDLANGIQIAVNPLEQKVLQFQVAVQDIDNMSTIVNKAQVNVEPERAGSEYKETNEVTYTYVEPIITAINSFEKQYNTKYAVEREKIKYIITVVNAGGIDKEVEIKGDIPENTTFIEDSIKIDEQSTYELAQVDLSKKNITDLTQTGIRVNVPAKANDINGEVKLSYEVRINNGATGDITNVATIDNNQTDETRIPIVTYQKTSKVTKDTRNENVTTNEVMAGDSIYYEISVNNTGSIDVENITVKDTVPTGTKPVEEQKNGDTGLEWLIGSLKAGTTQKVGFAVEAEYIAKDYKITNIATVDGLNTNQTENLYKKSDITLTSEVTMTGQNVITSKDTAVYNEINFKAVINDFVGKAKIVIVNKLPFPIDEANSKLGEGKYDSQTQTITWEKIVDSIDTVYTGRQYEISLTEQLELKYIYGNLDNTTGSMENVINSSIELQCLDDDKYVTLKTDEHEIQVQTQIKIPSEVVVYHYIYDEEKNEYTNKELVPAEHIQGIVGEAYKTTPSSKVPKNYVCTKTDPENYEGKMTEKVKEVKYYYLLQRPSILATLNETAKTQTNDAVLRKEDGVVEYNIEYNINVENYIGKLKIELTDKLPAKIDLEKSDIANGVYNEESQTITWTEEVSNYQEGTYVVHKKIEIVYKNQDVLAELENVIEGKVTTYYPENHTTTPGEKLVEEQSQDSVKIKQEYKANLKIIKDWEDNDDLKEKRPESITVTIVKNPSGTKETKVLNKQENWTYLLENLDKYDNNGNKITYEVTEKETNENDLEYYEPGVIKLVEDQDNRSTTYTYLIKNKYRLLKTDLNEKIELNGSKSIKSSSQKVDYTIKFKTEIKEFIGEGKIKIVDTLPYKIDSKKSNLDGGKYNDEERTITWEEELPHVNVIEDEIYNLEIEKQISVLYKDIDLTKDSMVNTVHGETQLYDTEQKDEVSAKYETKINVNGTVNVRYMDKQTDKDISAKDYNYTITGKVGEEYSTKKLDIENYDYINSTNNEIGKIREGALEVIYYYERTKAEVIVKYQDSSGNTLQEDTLIKGQVLDKYETHPKDIQNYKLIKSTDNTSGTMTKETITVIYTYEKIPAKVVVEYLEQTENGDIELLPTDIIEGFVGDKYETRRKVVNNYRLSQPEPQNSSGTMTEEEIRVKYYYEKIPSGVVTVKYVDVETNQEIPYEVKINDNESEQKIYGYEIKGFVGDNYTTEEKEIPYYVFLNSSDNTEGTLTEMDQTISYYYRKLVFNFKVEKSIKEVTLNGKNVKIYNNQLTKLEVPAKEVYKSEIIMKYYIDVTNIGELSGKINLEEIIPEGCKLIETNGYWKNIKDGVLQTELELGAGENKRLEITVKWINGDDNFGPKLSVTNILSTENEANFVETTLEDNKSVGTIIISVRTGIKEYTGLIVGMIIVLSIISIIILKIRKKQK